MVSDSDLETPIEQSQALEEPASSTEESVETLVEEVSIDGMCGVY